MLKTFKIKFANYGINKVISNDLISNFMFITTYVFVNNQIMYKKKPTHQLFHRFLKTMWKN